MGEHIEEDGGPSARPDEGLLREIRQASADFWRRAGARAVGWSTVCLGSTQAILCLGLWLLPGGETAGGSWRGGAWVAWGILVLIALGAGVSLAFIDSLRISVADGPLLPRLGKVLCPPDPGRRPASPEAQFAAFGSPQALSRAARLLDLPLIVFLARAVLGVDAKRLLGLAQGGADRETVLHELVRMARAHAAASLHRARLVVWTLLGLAASSATVLVWWITG